MLLASRLLGRCFALKSFSNFGSRPAVFRQRVLFPWLSPATTSYMSPASACRSLTIRKTCRLSPARDSLRRTWCVTRLTPLWEASRVCLAGRRGRAPRLTGRRRAPHAGSSTSASSMSLLVMTSPRHQRFRRSSAAVVGSLKR